jgi:hypothetical protein
MTKMKVQPVGCDRGPDPAEADPRLDVQRNQVNVMAMETEPKRTGSMGNLERT